MLGDECHLHTVPSHASLVGFFRTAYTVKRLSGCKGSSKISRLAGGYRRAFRESFLWFGATSVPIPIEQPGWGVSLLGSIAFVVSGDVSRWRGLDANDLGWLFQLLGPNVTLFGGGVEIGQRVRLLNLASW